MNQNANKTSTGAPSRRGLPGCLLELPVWEVGVWFLDDGFLVLVFGVYVVDIVIIVDGVDDLL